MASSTHSDASELKDFRPLINAINLKALASIALETRLRRMPAAKRDTRITCAIGPTATAGSYNLVYTIQFSDNVRWIARFPGNGTSKNFGDLDRQRMHSDYNTMRLVRSATTFPVPEVFAFETAITAVGAPYALLAFVEGSRVSDRWFDKSWITEERRVAILKNLASCMSELHTLRYDKLGSLIFDESGRFTHVGPKIDREVLLNVGFGLKNRSGAEAGEDTIDFGRLDLSGPFDSAREELLDSWDDLERALQLSKAELALVRLAVDSTPERLTTHRGFFPSPPDFDSQNVFIDRDGGIIGFIDWDGAHTQSPIASFARYPSWITPDWDPIMYAYDEEDAEMENSPEELERYRRIYAAAFAGVDLPATCYLTEDTKLSHLLEALGNAAQNRLCRQGIVPKLLEHAFKGKMPFKYRDFLTAWEEGNAGIWMRQIEEAFKDMWHAE